MDLRQIGLNDFFSEQFKTTPSAPDLYHGRVANIQKGTYLLLGPHGELRARLSGGYLHRSHRSADLPVVGDWVLYSWKEGDQTALLRKCLNRKNCISRGTTGSGRDKHKAAVDQQIIAANIDFVFIISGLDRDYNPRRIERYLTIVYDSGATPVIVLNKTDLCDRLDEILDEVSGIAIGVPVYAISAEKQASLPFFDSYLTTGKTGALLGSSGVGKSTIINRLLGKNRQAVHSVSSQVGKGMHTTTSRELILLPQGGILIDNPGMRELQLFSDESGLETVFGDIEELAANCRFSDCSHGNEPGCAVKKALVDNRLDRDRYNSYLKLQREINFLEEREVKGHKAVEREQHRRIRLYQRQLKKQRRF